MRWSCGGSAYRSGIKGAGSLFPRDAVLNLPPCGYSWALQRLAEMFILSGAYEQAHEFVLAATGVSVGRRQLEQITAAAAADAERFCQDRDRAPSRWPGQRRRGEACRRWRSRRTARAWRCGRRPAAPRPPARPRASRGGVRQAAGHRAEVRLQADRRDRRRLRRPAAGGAQDPGADHGPGPRPGRPEGPRAVNRWYTARSPSAAPRPSPPCSTRPSAATPATPGPGSRWWTATTTRST